MENVIVLNRNFEYWREAPIKKVLTWFVQDKIEVVVEHESQEVGSVTFRIKMPLVVRLLHFVGYKPKSAIIPFSQEAVFNRDNYICQFYHKDENGKKIRYKCNYDEATIDHIVPLSHGGKSEFRNCVCACRKCNEILKKNRTPREAGLELIRIPVIPKRDKNSYVIARFNYNPKKLAHIKYFKEILGR